MHGFAPFNSVEAMDVSIIGNLVTTGCITFDNADICPLVGKFKGTHNCYIILRA